MKNTALTLTVIANMTSNYSETLGNISSVQKVYRGGKEYATRSRESLKNAICVQAGLYDDLQTSVDGAVQKLVRMLMQQLVKLLKVDICLLKMLHISEIVHFI